MISTTISNLVNLFIFAIIISIFGFLPSYVLYEKNSQLANNLSLKSFEILTIAIIFLLFGTTNQPLPILQINPPISSTTYVFTVTLLLLYIFYIETETELDKKEPANKFKITKILLNKAPRILLSIVLVLWVGSYMLYYILQSVILLDSIVILLYYILAASIIYILFTFFYIFFVEIFLQEADKEPKKKHKKNIPIN
ncbi:MAG: hypothetical protein RXQ77_04010 [Candidatus Nanopusillus sp.]